MSGVRTVKTRVKTAKKRSSASTAWLGRQLNDPFVHEAKRQGYRARSVFKLEEIDAKHRLIRRGARILDLGAAPGSWAQYAVSKGASVVAVDLLPMTPLAGVVILRGDFLEPATQAALLEALGGPPDLILSDIAPDTTGRRAVDRLRAEAVAEAVLDFAGSVLPPGGHCLLKLLKGGEAKAVPLAMRAFEGYRLLKPAATRQDSSELFMLATSRRPEPSG